MHIFRIVSDLIVCSLFEDNEIVSSYCSVSLIFGLNAVVHWWLCLCLCVFFFFTCYLCEWNRMECSVNAIGCVSSRLTIRHLSVHLEKNSSILIPFLILEITAALKMYRYGSCLAIRTLYVFFVLLLSLPLGLWLINQVHTTDNNGKWLGVSMAWE